MTPTLHHFAARRKSPLGPHLTYGGLCEIMGETSRPHELWNGQLVIEPSATCSHQEIVSRFYLALREHVRGRALGRVFFCPLDMVLSPDTFVQPDVIFVSNENLPRIRKTIRGPADLVAEVISPRSVRRDWVQKKHLYERYGVREYWIVDPAAGAVEVFSLSADRRYESTGPCGTRDTASSRLLEGFKVRVAELLERI